MKGDDETERDLVVIPTPKPPPPSAALRDAVAAMRPVKTRRPFRAFLAVVACGLVTAALAVVVFHLRRDQPYLQPAWWWTMMLVWLIGFCGPLFASMVPTRDAVLPHRTRAARAAGLAATVPVAAGLLLTKDAPPYTLLPDGAAATLGRIAHCLALGVAFWAPCLALALWTQRRVILTGSAGFGAGLGAAGGALAGLTLHLICPYGGGLHVGLAHGGCVFVGAVAGGLAARLFLGRIWR
jgi:hypothetical protein